MWRRIIEGIQDDLIHSPARPWLLKPDVWDNAHVVISEASGQEVFRVPIPARADGEEVDQHGFRIARQYRGLKLLVDVLNNTEYWFEEFRRLGVDLVIPPKPHKKNPKVVFVPPEPVTFNVKDFKRDGQPK